MKRLLLSFLSVCTICVFSVTGAFGYMITAATDPTGAEVSTKWEPGGNSALIFNAGPAHQIGPGTPGDVTWSIMAPQHIPPYMAPDVYHPGNLSNPVYSYDFFGLTAFPDGSINTSHFPTGVMPSTYAALAASWGISVGAAVPYEALVVDWALDVWAAVSGFSNLGPVADGDGGTANNGNYPNWNGNGAYDSAGGNLGDIRIAAFDFLGTVLADTYNPGDASSPGFNQYSNIGGDAHFAKTVANISGFHWLNDPNHSLDPGPGYDPNGFDFQTNVLHEMGHALGLDHTLSGVNNVMNMYGTRHTALRTLTADDIAGIQAIYGPESVIPGGEVPEPCTMILLGSGLLGLAGLRKKFKK